MGGVFGNAPSHPTDPIAQFVRILQGLMASLSRTGLSRAPKTRTTSASLFETLLWHLDYFLRRLTAPIRPRKPTPKPAHPHPNPNTPANPATTATPRSAFATPSPTSASAHRAKKPR